MNDSKLNDNWLKAKKQDKKITFDGANDVFNGWGLISLYMSIGNAKKLEGWGKYERDGDPCYIFNVRIGLGDGRDEREVVAVKVDRISLMADYKYLEFTEEEKNFFKHSKLFKDLFFQLVDKQYDDLPRMYRHSVLEKNCLGRDKVKELLNTTIESKNFKFKFYK